MLAAIVGVLVSLASWAFLEAVHWTQVGLYEDLPDALGFDAVPAWWPLPILAVAGVLTAAAVIRLPGGGGHVPYEGIKGGVTWPEAIPGVLLAGLASLGMGLVLGPEAPLIGLGAGLAIFAVKKLRNDASDQVIQVIAASAAFAALASVFGSPVVGAVILIEAAGLGGAMLPLILLPGLMAAGIGSLLYVGLNDWTGLSNSAYALSPFSLPAYTSPTITDFGWTIALAVAAAVCTRGIVLLAHWSAVRVSRRPWALIPASALLVGALAICFQLITDESANVVLFSGEDSFGALLDPSADLALSTLALLLLFKGAAWALSMGSFRGGPTFPALFIGAVGGLIAAELPGYSETPAIAAVMAATAVSILRLPLSAVVITLLLTGSAGAAVAPIVIVAVVVAYITIESMPPTPTKDT